jgi:hypothetical protein
VASPKKPGGPGKGKRGGSKPGRTRAGAALVVAARAERRPPPPPGPGPDGVHEAEFTETPARPAGEPPSSLDRARAIRERVKHAGGRPCELTPDVIDRTVAAVLDGASPKNALRGQGFDESTYLAWRRRAKEDLAADPPRMTLHVEFSLSIDAAIGEFGQEAAIWLSQNRGTPAGQQSAGNVKFLLDRRYADEYGAKQSVELTGADGGPVQTEAMPPREALFAEIAAKLGPDATLFFLSNRRWPTSVEEVEAWLASRAPKGDASSRECGAA